MEDGDILGRGRRVRNLEKRKGGGNKEERRAEGRGLTGNR